MLITSLTGGIATGKSVVAQILKELGCYIHKADQVAHQLMEPREPAWEEIFDHFGPSILNLDKTINRAKLGALVFSNREERLFLNKLLHPLIFKKREEAIKRLKIEGDFKIFVSEAALTIEAGYVQFFDKIIVTHCQKKNQISRLKKRDQIIYIISYHKTLRYCQRRQSCLDDDFHLPLTYICSNVLNSQYLISC